MNNSVRCVLFVAICCVCMGTLVSCFKSNSNDPVQQLYIIGTLHKNAVGDVYFVQDDGITVKLDPDISPADSLIGERFYVEGFFKDAAHAIPGYDYTMEAVAIVHMPILPIMSVTNAEESMQFGQDLYHIQEEGLFITGHYLNAFIDVMTRDAQTKIQHTFALVHNTYNARLTDHGDTVYVELRYNAAGDTGPYTLMALRAFELQPLIEAHPNLVLGVWYIPHNATNTIKKLQYFPIVKK